MKKRHIILLVSAVVLVALLQKKKSYVTVDVIKPGDKGNNVAGIQSVLVSITGVKLSNIGVYDNETLSAVQYYMNGCDALIDTEKGYVDNKFASDLYKITNNAKNS